MTSSSCSALADAFATSTESHGALSCGKAAAISLSRPSGGLTSVQMYSERPPRPPAATGSCAVRSSCKQSCVLPTVDSPTSSVRLPPGMPPCSSLRGGYARRVRHRERWRATRQQARALQRAASAPVDDGAAAGAHGRAPQRLWLHAAPREQRRLRWRRLNARQHGAESSGPLTAPHARRARPAAGASAATRRAATRRRLRRRLRGETGGGGRRKQAGASFFAPKSAAVPAALRPEARG